MFDKTKIGVRLDFDHPEYISVDDYDIMKITFTKTEAWLRSATSGIESIPDGFVLDIILPP